MYSRATALIVVLFAGMFLPFAGHSAETPDTAADCQKMGGEVFTVQAKASLSKEPALATVKILKNKGYNPFVLLIRDSKNRSWFTVHAGMFENSSEAHRAKKKLKRVYKPDVFVFKTSKLWLRLFQARERGESTEAIEACLSHGVNVAQASTPAVRKDLTVATSNPSGKNRADSPDKPSSSGFGPQNTGPDVSKVQPAQPTSEPPTPKGATTDTQRAKTSESNPKKGSWLSKDERGWYVVMAAGFSRVHFGDSDLEQGLSARGHPVDAHAKKTDFGGKWMGGFRFHENVAVELGYVHLGQRNYSLDAPAGTNAAALAEDALNVAPTPMGGGLLEVVGIWPVQPNIAVQGKAGILAWRGERKIEIGTVSAKKDKDGFDLALGTGGRYWLTPNISTSVEWEHFFSNPDVDFVSGGVQYKF